jgi:hypothetical protein
MSDLIISAIGSCRVFSPLRCAQIDHGFKIGHGMSEWFTHSTKDVIQKIGVLNGVINIPPELVPLVCSDLTQYAPNEHRFDFFSGTDCFIIEICSVISNNIQGVELQQWRITNLKLLHKSDIKAYDHRTVQIKNYLELKDIDSKAVLPKIETNILNANEIITDLKTIHSALDKRPIVFVSHNLLKRSNGEVPEARLTIYEALSTYAKQTPNVLHFDPTVDIYDFGVDDAMTDINHYTNAFDKYIGSSFYRSAIRLINK